MIRRRQFLQQLGAAGAMGALAGCASTRRPPASARVLVVGGGFGGATAAKYLRLLSGHALDVTLIEPNAQFVSSPVSNLVIAGSLQMADITMSYEALGRSHGVRVLRERATLIDAARRRLTLGNGSSLRYDKLVLAPGIDPMFERIDGLAEAHAAGRIVQGWAAGPETLTLREQLVAMADGGVFIICVPEAPYRCPPGPYERASLVAAYLQKHKPRSKVLVLDANPDVVALAPLYRQAWSDLYGGLLEYRNHYTAVSVDADSLVVRFEVQEDERGDVLNVLPPVRAGTLALHSGLANSNARWCEVDFLSFASTNARDVHVLGDAIQAAPMMPKSGHMANAHAKVAAAAIVAELQDQPIDPQPMMSNTCYSFLAPGEAVHSATVYAYSPAGRTFVPVPGASAPSLVRSGTEADYAMGWARSIWNDMLG